MPTTQDPRSQEMDDTGVAQPDSNWQTSAATEAPLAEPVDAESGTLALSAIGWLQQVWVWGSSFAMHFALLAVCSLVYMTVDIKPPVLDLSAEMTDPDVEEFLPQEMEGLDAWNVGPDVKVSLLPAKTVAETMKNANGRKDPISDLAIEEVPANPLAYSTQDVDMDEVVAGIAGSVLNTQGDVGTVDRITTEILRELRTSKVAVVWLLDASGSLRMRREQVIRRFDRIYQELDELAEGKADALLTSVIAFGEKATLMTPEPTSDREAIRKAVRDIKTDETGIENVFTVVKKITLEYRKLKYKGYKIMIVLLTDESGNDRQLLDDAIQQVKQYEMPVYVMGPLAPFERNEIKVKWVDEQTGEQMFLPVDRGPESAVLEFASLPSWHKNLQDLVLSSGFGPYALARLARESGGIYFLYDDGNIPGPKFNVVDLLDYTPDYVSPKEYQRLIEKNLDRKAVVRVAMAARQAKLEQPKTKFLESGIQFAIRDSQKPLKKLLDFLNHSINELQAVEKIRERETSKRWQAHYDVFLGQLLTRRVHLRNSLPLLQEMYTKPKVCQDGTTNAWELVGLPGTALGKIGTPSKEPPSRKKKTPTLKKGAAAAKSKKRKTEPQTNTQDFSDDEDIQLARKYLQRVVTEHPRTPWATIAQTELDTPVAFRWAEAFMIPPKGEKLPWDKKPLAALTEKQKKAKAKFERFQRERKKKQEEKTKLVKKQGGKPVPKKIPKL